MEPPERIPVGFQFPINRFIPDFLRVRNRLARECLSEFICTFLFLLVGVGCTIQIKTAKGTEGNFLSLNVCWGFAVAFAAGLGIWLSGGHINPSVSLSQWALGRLSLKQALAFSVMHVVGAFVGTAVAYLDYLEALNIFDGGHRLAGGPMGSLCFLVTCPGDYTSHLAGVFDQIVGTGILTLTMAAMLDKRNAVPKWLHPLFGGFTVMMIGMAFAQNDGYPINPARDLGARLFAWCIYGKEAWSFHNYWWWVPVVGPLIGGFVGVYIYVIFIDMHSWSNEEEKQLQGHIRRSESAQWAETHTISKKIHPVPPVYPRDMLA